MKEILFIRKTSNSVLTNESIIEDIGVKTELESLLKVILLKGQDLVINKTRDYKSIYAIINLN